MINHYVDTKAITCTLKNNAKGMWTVCKQLELVTHAKMHRALYNDDLHTFRSGVCITYERTRTSYII